MKVCIVSSGYPPDDAGGIGTYTQTLARGLAQGGNTVVIISKSAAGNSYVTEDGIHIYRVQCRSLPWIEKLLPGLSWSVQVFILLKAIKEKHQIDIVEFPNWEAPGLVSQYLLPNLHSVVRVHTPYFEILQLDKAGNYDLADKMICFQEKISCLKAKALVSSTRTHANLIANQYQIDPSKINILPLGVTDHFSLAALQYKLAQTKKTFKVLYVSRLENRKGTLLLLDAIPELLANRADIQIDIIGRDRRHAPGNILFEQYFRLHYGAYAKQVHFHGFVPEQQMADFYLQADIFLVPSLYESFGLIYAEAMMYGLPSIATDGGGIPEVITDKSDGFLIKNKSKTDLTDHFGRLYQDRELLTQMSLNARAAFERKFDYRIMADNTLQLYTKTTQHRKEAPNI